MRNALGCRFFGLGVQVDRVAADRAVTGTKLVALQGIQNTKGFLRIPPHVQRIDRYVLNYVMRVHDESGAQGDAGRGITNAQTVDKTPVIVGKTPLVQFVQVRMFAAPCQFTKFIVGASPRTTASRSANSSFSLANSTISVGQTNVKSFG